MRHIITIILSCLLLASCVTSKKINYLQSGRGIQEYADTIEYVDYKLQKGDYLYIYLHSTNKEDMDMFNGNTGSNSTQNQLMNMSSDNPGTRLYLYLIDNEGMINYPYIGKVKADGLETRELKFKLEEKLAALVSNFSLNVRLSNRTFSVLGEGRSGRFQIPKEKLTIYQALALSGDLATYAKRNKIQLIRDTPEGVIVKTFDIRSESIINSEYYYIQPNDVIYVPFDNAKFFGVTHFTGILSLSISTISFGLLIYGIVNSLSK